jgi:hypothetical protein
MNQSTLNINYHTTIIHTNYEQFATVKGKDVYTRNIEPDFKKMNLLSQRIKKRETIILLCYSRAEAYCHRYVIKLLFEPIL